MSQYWGSLSPFLTKLKLSFGEDVDSETSSTLNQLTQLQGLSLAGRGPSENSADIHLELPRLTKLTLIGFEDTSLTLVCPKLRNLKLLCLGSIQEMNGMPKGLESLRLDDIGDGSVPFEQMLPEQGLKHLLHLDLIQCPGQPTTIRDAWSASILTSLNVDRAWAPLMTFLPPWQGVPFNLQHVRLALPLDDGIPLVYEQLSGLISLTLQHVGEGPMHLTRPLDPFLDMTGLVNLALLGDSVRTEPGRWTPAALRLLGLADRRLLLMHTVPSGSPLHTSKLKFSY